MRIARPLSAIALILVVLFASVWGQDDGVIRIETDLVLINATVTDSAGRYIANLKIDDFLLEEEGVRRQIAHFATEETPFAATILIDASESMKTKLARARVAASQFVEALRVNDVVAVYGFNSSVEQLQDFSGDRDISPDVWEIEARGTTRLHDCIYEALEALANRAEQRRAVVLISDGADTSSRHTDNDVLTLSSKLGATIYTIDISERTPGRDADTLQASGTLKRLAEKTGGQYMKTLGGQELTKRLSEIAKELRSQYTLGFYPDKRTGPRWHQLTLKVPARQGVQVRARQGYFGLKISS
ncbi:MAG: VWA domain-containing protein [Acidobacteriota bacterium]